MCVFQKIRKLPVREGSSTSLRDLCWENTTKDNSGNVRIIDLEHTGKEGKVDFTLQSWPVELGDGIYTNEIDILPVQRMLLCYLNLYSGD